MYVVNFDFSDHMIIQKLLAINIPVLVSQAIAYPLQRIQTLLMAKPLDTYYTKNQFSQARLILKQMLAIEGFPKFYHGLRYSLDCGMTQMTTKFIVFDYLMSKQKQSSQDLYQQSLEQKSNQKQKAIKKQSSFLSKFKIYGTCLFATTIGTIASQSAFNFQIIASSLPVDKNNRDQNVKLKLIKYTKSRNVPFIGLKYTIPISILNTISELVIFHNLNHYYSKSKHFLGFKIEEFLTAQAMLLATVIPYHFVYQRQIQQTLEMKKRLPFSQGFLGTFCRHNIKGLLLYACYHFYSEYLIKKQIANQFSKRQIHQSTMGTRL